MNEDCFSKNPDLITQVNKAFEAISKHVTIIIQLILVSLP